MVKLIIGKKGSGKTKQLIDAVNQAVETDKGHIVFINNGNRHMLDLNHKIRFVDTVDFSIENYCMLYGLICGLLAEDYDISNIFVDSITKVVAEDIKNSKEILAKIKGLSNKFGFNVIVTASIDIDDELGFISEYL